MNYLTQAEKQDLLTINGGVNGWLIAEGVIATIGGGLQLIYQRWQEV